MFTYKKDIPTGQYRSFVPEHHDIKLNKKVVGSISHTDHFAKEYGFKIRLAIKKEKTDKDPANFKWVTFKRLFESADEAKAFLKENFERITKELDLHYFEN